VPTLAERLRDPWWRLNNLYRILDKEGKEVPFRCNAEQEEFYRTRHNRSVILKARQLGFSTLIQLMALDKCLFTRNIKAVVIADTKDNAQSIFRDKVKFAFDRLPPEIREHVKAEKNEAGELILSNGSSIKVTTSGRSGTAQFLHVSELGPIAAKYPQKAREVLTGSLPAVHGYGDVFVESTAMGKEGAFYDLCESSRKVTAMGGALSPLEFKFHFAPWWRGPGNVLAKRVEVSDRVASYLSELEKLTGFELLETQRWWYAATERLLGEDMRREHPSTPEEAFEQSVEGAYWAWLVMDAYRQQRVGHYPAMDGLPVHTAWDLGVSDLTAIWLYQIEPGGWVRVVKYIEHGGEGMGWYIERLRGLRLRFGRFFGPHDLAVTEWGSGRSRLEMARDDHGVSFELVPRLSLADGIGAVRKVLPKCVFDEAGCGEGLKRLSGYRRDWNDALGTWKDRPRHDVNSHGADAFRVLALSEAVGVRSGPEQVGGDVGLSELVERCARKG
jgi:hypothetical protein